MKRLLWIAAAVLAASCANKPPAEQAKNPDEKNIYDLNYFHAFGFEKNGHRYTFSSVNVSNDVYNCQFVFGMKDGVLAYELRSKDIQQLRPIYEANVSVEQKMDWALEKIESLSKRNIPCNAEEGTPKPKKEPTINQIMAFVVYAPLVAISIPFGLDLYAAHLNDTSIRHRLKSIQLGMSPEDVVKKINFSYRDISTPNYLIQEIKTEYRTLVFVYKENKLIAYVWGRANDRLKHPSHRARPDPRG